jgi:23S rRNA maturation mini-RNase III
LQGTKSLMLTYKNSSSLEIMGYLYLHYVECE